MASGIEVIMETKRKLSMETIETYQVELRLKQLLQELERLRTENQQLRQHASQGERRQGPVGNKNQVAIEKLKKIIKQLRDAMS